MSTLSATASSSAATEPTALERALADVKAKAVEFARLPPLAKAALARECVAGLRAQAADWVARGAEMRDADPGEEWLAGPVPSIRLFRLFAESLEQIALETWKQPRARVHRIANGIATALYGKEPEPKAIPGFVRRANEVVIGTVAGLRAVKDLPQLVRAVGGVSARFRLVIVGEGPEKAAIEQAALAMGIDDRVVMPGFLDRPYRFMRHFDLLALSSKSEQFPISVVEAAIRVGG